MKYIKDFERFESLLGNLIWDFYQDDITHAIQREYALRNINPETKVYALDAYGFSEELEKIILNEKAIKVFFVINLTKSSAPYLKYADLIIFLSPEQSRLYDLLFQYTKPSVILQLSPKTPEKPSETNLQRQGLTILLGWHYRPYEYPKLSKRIVEVVSRHYKDLTLDTINIVCQFPLLKNRKLVEYLEKLFNFPVRLVDVNNFYKAENVLLRTQYVEVVDQGDFEDPFRILSNPAMRFEIRSVDYDVSAKMWPIIATSFGCDSRSRFYCDYISKPYFKNNELCYVQPSNYDVEGEAINIIHGEPLHNRYVLSVLFRNVGDKLIRCVNSILNTRKNHDVGVVMVDDCSSDDVVEKAAALLQENGVPVCVVRNKERRYAAHNYYLVINRLVINDESVIIDLDGDDQLNEEFDVFGELDAAYANDGVQKTFGAFTTVADDAGEQVDGTTKEIFKKIFQGYQLLNETTEPFNQFRCQPWLHLRSAKRGLLKQVDEAYFKSRSTGAWLKTDHDTSINSHAIELAGSANVRFIDKPLYIYDITGPNHDFMEKRGADVHDVLLDVYRAFKFDNVDRSVLD